MSSNTTKIRSVPMVNRYSRDVFFASASSNTCKIHGVPMVSLYSRDVSMHRRAATHVKFAVCLWCIGTVETFLCNIVGHVTLLVCVGCPKYH